jgi:hypothetical protein
MCPGEAIFQPEVVLWFDPSAQQTHAMVVTRRRVDKQRVNMIDLSSHCLYDAGKWQRISRHLQVP